MQRCIRYKGLKAAFYSEPAVRQEMAAMVVLIPVACYVDVTLTERLLLIMCLFIVLITELLNSALEALADRVSTKNTSAYCQSQGYRFGSCICGSDTLRNSMGQHSALITQR